MGKKLAIEGHPTRGKEVIELLEMMGGKKFHKFTGNNNETFYYIDNINNIDCDWRLWNNNRYTIFTLEEFLEKYPFKINDKVIDKADGCPGVVCEMKWDENVSDMKYYVAFGNGIDFGWFVNDSIEFCKENKNLKENKFPSFEPMFKMNDELEYKIPDGYEITEVSKDKVFIKPIKSKYPTVYEECVRIAKNIHGYDIHVDAPAYGELMESFVKLLICRDAYWKIAGEEMGLGKPWEPDWNGHEFKYGLKFMGHRIEKTSEMTISHVICFPTEEMRDAFYENFKNLIEQCKELL